MTGDDIYSHLWASSRSTIKEPKGGIVSRVLLKLWKTVSHCRLMGFKGKENQTYHTGKYVRIGELFCFSSTATKCERFSIFYKVFFVADWHMSWCLGGGGPGLYHVTRKKPSLPVSDGFFGLFEIFKLVSTKLLCCNGRICFFDSRITISRYFHKSWGRKNLQYRSRCKTYKKIRKNLICLSEYTESNYENNVHYL